MTTTLPPPASAAAELLRRQAAKRSLTAYQRYLAPIGHPDFLYPPAEHHLIMQEHLETLWASTSSSPQRLMILAPPGSAKSTYVSVRFATWALAQDPSALLLCCSNTTDLAEAFNRRRRATCMTAEWERLADTTLDPDDRGVARFGTRRGGAVVAAGVGSAIVGFRSTLNILDDPHRSVEETLSTAQLDKIFEWYLTEYRSRLVPTGKEVLVSTRWAARDLPGRLLQHEPETWTVLRLPMLADDPDDPLGRPLGTPLWPEWFSTRQITENQKDPWRWSAMYQQVPLDTAGTWVPKEHLRIVSTPLPEGSRIFVAIDLALTIGKGDYTVIATAALTPQRRLRVLHVSRLRVDAATTLSNLYLTNETWDPLVILIDDDPAAKAFTRLAQEIARTKGPLPLKALPMRNRDKETKATALRGWFLQDNVELQDGPWLPDLLKELSTFPASATDDQVDALALIARELPKVTAVAPTPTELPAYRGLLERHEGQIRLTVPLEELYDTPRTGNRERVS